MAICHELRPAGVASRKLRNSTCSRAETVRLTTNQCGWPTSGAWNCYHSRGHVSHIAEFNRLQFARLRNWKQYWERQVRDTKNAQIRSHQSNGTYPKIDIKKICTFVATLQSINYTCTYTKLPTQNYECNTYGSNCRCTIDCANDKRKSRRQLSS